MKFQLFYPLRSTLKSQDFGSKAFLSYYKDNGVMLSGHNGIDYPTEHGTPIRAAHNGIAYYEVDDKQGHGVVIRTNDKYDYEGGQAYFKSIYWHMIDGIKEPKYISPIMGNNGKKVKVGDVIGYIDSTGLSTGHHLHFAVKPVAVREPPNTYYNIKQTNGMMGAVDPNPYFNGKFAADYASFERNLEVGMMSEDVRRLQNILRRMGYFTYPLSTGYYGGETAKAVLKFQWDNKLINAWQYFYYGGEFFHQKTRDKLNEILEREVDNLIR